ncbi:MAG TPA: PilN domain-containing protein [Nitrospiraceae bacterium]|nr:PilN domain-containing protein [Nitrospiraceae bacterium]
MIRINLLAGPRARKVKPEWDVRAELALGVGLVVLTVGACFYYSGMLDQEIEARQAEKQDKGKQLVALKEKVKQVQDFEERKKLLEDKNRIIEQLEKARVGPVRVLDYVSRGLEPLKLWLVRLSIKGNNVEVEGRALTNDDVVEFVNNLRQTDYFSSILLRESRAGTEGKVNLYQFKMDLVMKG